MTLRRTLIAAALALCGLSAASDTAQASWNNAFLVACGDCRPRTSFRIVDDCPKPEVRRSYVQRTYYTPVTEWKAEKYLEPVRVNYRSSYWEPVQSYTYSSYYDPCSGECQQIATPHTEFRLKTQCNTALKYVERTRMVPVQTLKPVTMMQPVVTYYYPPRPVSSGFTSPGIKLYDAPEVEQLRSAPQTEIERNGTGDKINPPGVPSTPPRTMPDTNGTGRARTASQSTASAVRGEVVEKDRVTPKAGTKVIFVNAANAKDRRDVVTSQFGEFDATLPAGEWHVYLGTGTGKAGFHSTITLKDGQTRDVTVASW